MKAVLQYRATPAFRSQIAALEAEWLRIVVVDDADKPAFEREMQDADVLLHVLEPVKAATIDAAPNLKLIQKLGIGVDTIDLEAARLNGKGLDEAARQHAIAGEHVGGPFAKEEAEQCVEGLVAQAVPAAIRGDTIWCIGMSEPNAGSDLAGLQTRAVLDGDGGRAARNRW